MNPRDVSWLEKDGSDEDNDEWQVRPYNHQEGALRHDDNEVFVVYRIEIRTIGSILLM